MTCERCGRELYMGLNSVEECACSRSVTVDRIGGPLTCDDTALRDGIGKAAKAVGEFGQRLRNITNRDLPDGETLLVEQVEDGPLYESTDYVVREPEGWVLKKVDVPFPTIGLKMEQPSRKLTGKALGKRLCEALGIDIHRVGSITLTCDATEGAKVTVERFVTEADADGIIKVLTEIECHTLQSGTGRQRQDAEDTLTPATREGTTTGGA